MFQLLSTISALLVTEIIHFPHFQLKKSSESIEIVHLNVQFSSETYNWAIKLTFKFVTIISMLLVLKIRLISKKLHFKSYFMYFAFDYHSFSLKLT